MTTRDLATKVAIKISETRKEAGYTGELLPEDEFKKYFEMRSRFKSNTDDVEDTEFCSCWNMFPNF